MKVDGIAALVAFMASMLLLGKSGWLSSEGPEQFVVTLLAVALACIVGGIVQEIEEAWKSNG